MMVDWALTFARDLSLAVWLGGLIVIDFVETPARFRVPGLSRNQVVAVGREVFAAFNRTETVAGAALVATSVALAARAKTVSYRWLAALVGVAQYSWARTHMAAVKAELDLVNRPPEDTRFDAVRRWHKTYVALDFLK